MAKFELQLEGKQLIIDPQENGVYRVMENEEKIGVVYATIDNGKVGWSTQDELPDDFVQQLGELITDHNSAIG